MTDEKKKSKVVKAELSANAKNKRKSNVKKASDDSMERLAKIMTDAPTLAKLANTEWEIRALKPAVQWEIAKVACEIHKVDNATFGDVIKGFATNLPAVLRVVTLALLNDRDRIENEYDNVYETLLWESNPTEWATLLFEILQLSDVSFFFQITDAIEIFRQMTLQRKMTMKEQKLL